MWQNNNKCYWIDKVEKSFPSHLKKLFIALCISELKGGFSVINIENVKFDSRYEVLYGYIEHLADINFEIVLRFRTK